MNSNLHIPFPGRRSARLLPAILCVICLCYITAYAASRPILLEGDASYDLYGHLEYYGDASGKRTFSEILSLDGRGFSSLKGYLNDGFAHKAVWVRFTVVRTAQFPDVAYLRLYPPQLDHVSAYIPDGESSAKPCPYREFHGGDHIAVVNRPAFNPNIVIPLSLPPDTPVTVYLRIESASPISLGGSIHSSNDLLVQTYGAMLRHGLFFGLILAIVLLNLIYFIRTGDVIFLYFSLYSAVVAASFIAIGEIPALFFFPRSGIVSDYLVCMCYSGELFMFSRIAILLFNTSQQENTPNTRFAHWYLVFMSLLACLNVVSIPLGIYHEITMLITGAGLLLFVLVLWLSFHYDTTAVPDGVLYLAAFNILNIAYLLFYLRQAGMIPLEWWNSKNFESLAVVYIFIIPLFMMRRLRAAEKKTIDAYRASEEKAVALAKEMTLELRKSETALKLALECERLIAEKKTRFLSMMSHEYRMPLSVMRSSLDIVDVDSGLSPKSRLKLDKMKRAIERLVDVMDVALERSRLADRHESSEISCFQFAPFIDGVLADFRDLCHECTVNSTLSTGSKEIIGDFQLLKTAFFNLLENALKYSPPDVPIELSSLDETDYIVVRLSNQGGSIDADEADRLFEKYARGRQSGCKSGTGVGLWLVRGIIDSHGGSISMESDESRVVVTVRIPVACSRPLLHERLTDKGVSSIVS